MGAAGFWSVKFCRFWIGIVCLVDIVLSDCPSNFRDSSIEPGEIASGKSVWFLVKVFSERSQYLVSNCTMTVQRHT
jgi:hypothetical protein